MQLEYQQKDTYTTSVHNTVANQADDDKVQRQSTKINQKTKLCELIRSCCKRNLKVVYKHINSKWAVK